MIILGILLGILFTLIFASFQIRFFVETRKSITLFGNIFKKSAPYSVFDKKSGTENIPQLTEVGVKNSDLDNLIIEINHYIVKTKGTTDFSVIQNKVERKINMRYEQATSCLTFPTYIGLMGTFSGVFIGIGMFNYDIDTVANISDSSIKNLLYGVLVSMFTSLLGLILSTWNTRIIGIRKKTIEEEKNEFYDFIQTELMPSIDVSMSSAITKLHETVDKFEPAFSKIINNFQNTFDRCTSAFGENFEKNVKALTHAVKVMGKNMEAINRNIDLQRELISTIKSDDISLGLQRYVDAANSFGGLIKSLDKFEEARRMMLAAAQESIIIQNQYSESLKIPQEVAIKINSILDRIVNFEQSLNEVTHALGERDILGRDIIERIRLQVNSINEKQEIADNYCEAADDKLKEMFNVQTQTIEQLNNRYRQAIDSHAEGFENMLRDHTAQLNTFHNEFITTLKERFNVEEVREEFTNLRKLESIEQKISEVIVGINTSNNGQGTIAGLQSTEINLIEQNLKALQEELHEINTNAMIALDNKRSVIGNIFGWGRNKAKN